VAESPSCPSILTAGSCPRVGPTGSGFIYEAVAQLRKEAGERQVPGARTAVVTTGGGTPSGVMLLLRDGA
jgi:Thiolase C-terminal domain-like